MFYPASFHRQLDLAAAVVVESVSAAAAAAEQKADLTSSQRDYE